MRRVACCALVLASLVGVEAAAAARDPSRQLGLGVSATWYVTWLTPRGPEIHVVVRNDAPASRDVVVVPDWDTLDCARGVAARNAVLEKDPFADAGIWNRTITTVTANTTVHRVVLGLGAERLYACSVTVRYGVWDRVVGGNAAGHIVVPFGTPRRGDAHPRAPQDRRIAVSGVIERAGSLQDAVVVSLLFSSPLDAIVEVVPRKLTVRCDGRLVRVERRFETLRKLLQGPFEVPAGSTRAATVSMRADAPVRSGANCSAEFRLSIGPEESSRSVALRWGEIVLAE